MSFEIVSISRMARLEKENFDLRIKLEDALIELDRLKEKYNKLCVYSKMLEDFIDSINHKIFKLKGLESPLLEVVERDPALIKLGCKFEEEWAQKHPKPILKTIKEEDEESGYGGFIQSSERFSDVGMNEDDFDEVNYYFSNQQMEEMNAVLGPHLEKMKRKPVYNDSRICYDAREGMASEALKNLHLKVELVTAIEEFGWQKIYINELSTVISVLLDGDDVTIEDPAKPNLHLRKIVTVVIAILQNIRPHIKCCQALFLVPLRELALKIHRVLKSLGKHLKVTSHVCVDGGTQTQIKQEVKILSDGAQVVIGTPPRVLDLIKRQTLGISHIKFLAMGDAVELFDEKNEYHTKTVCLNLPKDKQVVLLTSACNKDVTNICKTFMELPEKTIPVEEIPQCLEGVKQYYLNINYRDVKWRPLMDIRNHFPNMRTVVICNSHKRIVEWLSYQMRQKGETVLAAPATMPPYERERIFKEFAVGEITTLITTELSLKTGDFRLMNVDLLVNYDLPIMPQNYYERISFCGPDFERRGLIINFIAGKNHTQLQLLNKIAQFCDAKIPKLPITDMIDED